jgi:hypothetical protein
MGEEKGTRNCFIIIFLLSLLIFLFYHLISEENYGMMPNTLHPEWIMVKSRNCPFCVQQLKELQKKSSIQLKENLQILDQEKDSKALSQINLIEYKGVPHFQNMRTGESFSGFTKIEDLEKKIGKDSVKQWKNAIQTSQGVDAKTFIHRGIKHDWDSDKFPIN